MTSTADPVVMLSRALDQVDAVATGVQEAQMGLPTPCPDWDVGSVLRHLVRDVRNYVEVARGDTPDRQRAAELLGEPLGEHWLTDLRARSDDLLHAWHQAGPLDGTVELPGVGEVPVRLRVDQQTAEFTVHAWDLWKATGQRVQLDPEIGAYALANMSDSLRPEARGEVFRPEVPAPDDAPTYDRLAAFAGRDPAWSAPAER